MYTQTVKKSNKTKGKAFLPDPLLLNNKLKRARAAEKGIILFPFLFLIVHQKLIR